jgi:catechol 2,3-dioxygenase-like lactoylglutathione lyase family enzyme
MKEYSAMSETPFGNNVICQVGLIVSDIEAMAHKYCEIFGVEMPPIMETLGYEVSKTTYKGQPSNATAKLAFFNMGQVQIELIEPDAESSVWRDHLNEHGEGVHHIAFMVKDTDGTVKHLEKHGIGVLQQGLYSDASGMYTYMDSAPAIGVMLELLQNF